MSVDASSARLATAPHEFEGNLIFTADDLAPFYAIDAVVKQHDGATDTTISYDGREWEVVLTYQQSGLDPWADDSFQLQSVREYRIKAVAQDDGLGERKASFHVAPRWPNMTSGGEPVSTPDITGINVTTQGSNLQIDDYPGLLRAAADGLGIDPGYFEELHRYSNIYTYEEYVRLHRERSADVIGTEGPLRRIYEYVSEPGSFRELREDDRGADGYYHRVQVDGDGAAALLDGHRVGKQIKHYHPKHARSDADPSDALSHPKVGVAFMQKLTDDGAVAWTDRERLASETREQLLNVLAWAGLPVVPDPDTYIADTYFAVEPAGEGRPDVSIVEDPTPEIRREQDQVVIEGLTANPDLNASDRDVVELLTDGGAHVNEVADETGYCRRTIYRVVKRLEELLDVSNGHVELASKHLRDGVRTVFSQAREMLEDRATGEDSVFRKWANAHGITVENARQGRLVLRFGQVGARTDLKELVMDGLHFWKRDDRDPDRFKGAKARWTQPDGTRAFKKRLGLLAKANDNSR
jgi:hypothetical protein